jgi:hypothetical protein
LRFIRSDRTQYSEAACVTGNSLSGTLEGFTELDDTYAYGSSHGTGTFTGSGSERGTLDVSIAYRTDGGTSANSTLALDAVYDAQSSLAAIAGSSTEQSAGTVFSVSGNGQVFAQDAVSRSTINGRVALIDAS